MTTYSSEKWFNVVSRLHHSSTAFPRINILDFLCKYEDGRVSCSVTGVKHRRKTHLHAGLDKQSRRRQVAFDIDHLIARKKKAWGAVVDVAVRRYRRWAVVQA